MSMKLTNGEIERALKVKVGDRVKVHPFWHQTTHSGKLPAYVTVMAVSHGIQTQTRIAFKINEDRSGHWMDAAWFVFAVPQSDVVRAAM